jgi:hypothetical protein
MDRIKYHDQRLKIEKYSIFNIPIMGDFGKEENVVLSFFDHAYFHLYPTFTSTGTIVEDKKYQMLVGKETKRLAREHLLKNRKNLFYVNYLIFKSINKEYSDLNTKEPLGITGYYYILTPDAILDMVKEDWEKDQIEIIKGE